MKNCKDFIKTKLKKKFQCFLIDILMKDPIMTQHMS